VPSDKHLAMSTNVLPLLMIMGLSAVKEDWRGNDTYFATDRTVVILDNRFV
jgi:hypothetical protein